MSDDWVLPEDEGQAQEQQPSPGWVLPEERAVAADAAHTGPSGMVLGEATGPRGGRAGREGETGGNSVSIRLFRSVPTRLVVAVPEYVTWLLAYRAISLGAHLSILTDTPARWESLMEAVKKGGGTADLLGQHDRPPSAGLPYRPSLVIDDSDYFDGVASGMGPWQAMLVVQTVTTAAAVFALRSSDLALLAPWDQRVAEQTRRAYALTPAQVTSCNGLAENEIVLARPRRVQRVAVPPTATEYQVLFAS